LRYLLKSSNNALVTLGEELAMLEAYASIQKARFGESLNVTIDADDEATSVLVPRMLLQPLVENSISHGRSDNQQTLNVSVIAKRNTSGVTVSVIDDGAGLERDKMEVGIGLANTRE